MAIVLTEKQRAKRDEKIRKMYFDKQMSTRQIAAKLGTISKSRVHVIVQNG
jgi:DNA-binding transcriptional regulator LsrR (DeoR family)